VALVAPQRSVARVALEQVLHLMVLVERDQAVVLVAPCMRVDLLDTAPVLLKMDHIRKQHLR
jgi:hypothetical protein